MKSNEMDSKVKEILNQYQILLNYISELERENNSLKKENDSLKSKLENTFELHDRVYFITCYTSMREKYNISSMALKDYLTETNGELSKGHFLSYTAAENYKKKLEGGKG